MRSATFVYSQTLADDSLCTQSNIKKIIFHLGKGKHSKELSPQHMAHTQAKSMCTYITFPQGNTIHYIPSGSETHGDCSSKEKETEGKTAWAGRSTA
eukprot:891007-Pelagomonas_calceolata.AAC.4